MPPNPLPQQVAFAFDTAGPHGPAGRIEQYGDTCQLIDEQLEALREWLKSRATVMARRPPKATTPPAEPVEVAPEVPQPTPVTRWVIVHADGQAFAGITAGVARFTTDPKRRRCYLQPATARAMIKRHRLTDCEPRQIELSSESATASSSPRPTGQPPAKPDHPDPEAPAAESGEE